MIQGNQDDGVEVEEARSRAFYAKRLAIGVATAVVAALINQLFLREPTIYWFILGLLAAFLIHLGTLLFRDWIDQRIERAIRERREEEILLPPVAVTNEVVYTFYSKLLGLAYEDLLVEGTIDGSDGSMTVRRRSKVVSQSTSLIDTIDHYLLAEAREGTIELVKVECFTPFKTLTWEVHKATADSLTLSISIKPPLARGQILDFRVTEKTPPGSITRTKKEMHDKISRGEKVYPYESFFWDIIRPTKHLELRVLIPENLKPESCEPAVWFGASRIRHEQECERIKDSFREELLGDQYVLSLDVTYPIPGLRYVIQFIPRDAQ